MSARNCQMKSIAFSLAISLGACIWTVYSQAGLTIPSIDYSRETHEHLKIAPFGAQEKGRAPTNRDVKLPGATMRGEMCREACEDADPIGTKWRAKPANRAHRKKARTQ